MTAFQINTIRESSILDEFYVIATVILLLLFLVAKLSQNFSFSSAAPSFLKEQYAYSFFKSVTIPRSVRVVADFNALFQLAIVLLMAFNLDTEVSTWLSLVMLFILGALYLLNKRIQYVLLNWLFTNNKESNYYLFTFNNGFRFLGMLLIPINLLFFNKISLPYPILAGAVIALFIAWLLIRYVLIAVRYRLHQNLYFFLYLCALEIAPILAMLKLSGVTI